MGHFVAHLPVTMKKNCRHCHFRYAKEHRDEADAFARYP